MTIEEKKDYSLLLFKEATLREMLNVEPEEELNLELYVTTEEIIASGKPIPESAKHLNIYGLVVTGLSMLVHRMVDKMYVVHVDNRGSETHIIHLTGLDVDAEIDYLLGLCTKVKINDLNDPAVVKELEQRDPETLAGIIEDLEEVR